MNHSAADSQNLVPKILKLAMIAATVFYPIVAVIVVQANESPDTAIPEEPGPYLLAVAIAAVVMLVLSFWLPGVIVSDAKLESSIRAGDPKTPVQSCRGLLFTGFVIRLAFLEAVAIFGLMLSFILWDAKYAVGFAVVAAVFMLSVRLDTDRVEAIHRRIELDLRRDE